MAETSVSALTMVDAEPDRVLASIADYREFRPAILTPRFSDYEVLEGGLGAGSRVRWTLNPGRWFKRRARVWEISSEEVDGALVERDANSSAVLTWSVVPAPGGRSALELTLTITAREGLSGMRARSRANKQRHLYGEMLFELRNRLTEEPASGTAADSDTGNSTAAGEVSG